MDTTSIFVLVALFSMAARIVAGIARHIQIQVVIWVVRILGAMTTILRIITMAPVVIPVAGEAVAATSAMFSHLARAAEKW